MTLMLFRVRVKKDKIFVAVASFLIYLALIYSLESIMLENYGEFLRFKSGNSSQFIKIIAHLIPITLTALLIFLPSTDLIYSILCIILVLIIYPSFILWRNLNSDFRIILLNTFYFFSIYTIAHLFPAKFKWPRIKEQQKTTILMLMAVMAIIPFVFIFAPHIDFRNLILSNIYEARNIETELSNRYTDYVYSSLSNVVIPLLIVLALIKKEFIKVGLALGLLIFMFLVGGHKSVFFGTLLLVFFFYGAYTKKINIFLWGLLFFLCLAILFYWTNKDFYLTSLITRRIFFLPAILEIGYFDYYDGKSLYWSDSILKYFIDYPDVVSPRNLIGQHVLLNIYTNANNGIVSDGFMNLGVLGSVLNIVFVSIVYGVFNSLNISHRFFGLVFMLIFTFFSSYFFTTMITHGGFLFLLLAYFFLKDSHRTYDA